MRPAGCQHWSKLTIFNICRPPNSSAYSAKPSAFLKEFNSFLSVVATTPHEFAITGDFNIQVDKTTDSFPSQFLSSLSAFNLIQHVSFPTHESDHTLNLVITSVSSDLSPTISYPREFNTSSDHYPIFTKLNIKPSPRQQPKLCSFRRISSINFESFKLDLETSSLLTNSPTDHNDLLHTVQLGQNFSINTPQSLLGISSKLTQKIHGSILFFKLSNHHAAV